MIDDSSFSQISQVALFGFVFMIFPFPCMRDAVTPKRVAAKIFSRVCLDASGSIAFMIAFMSATVGRSYPSGQTSDSQTDAMLMDGLKSAGVLDHMYGEISTGVATFTSGVMEGNCRSN